MEAEGQGEIPRAYRVTSWTALVLAVLAPPLSWLLHVLVGPDADDEAPKEGTYIFAWVLFTVAAMFALLAVSVVAGLVGWGVARWGRPRPAAGPPVEGGSQRRDAALRAARDAAEGRR